MSNINMSVFKFEESTPIRTITIDDVAWFVGKDVCQILGYTNTSKAMNDHCKGITKCYPLQTGGGKQEIRILSEADVMRLICSSKLPAAQKFEQWVFEEVLPSIRKTGKYAVPVQPELPLEQPQTPDIATLLKMKYNGVPVIPTPDLATAFGITGQQLCKLKYDHNIFVDGLDVFRVKGVTYALTHRMIRAGYQTPLNVKSINLWTESGIRKLIPILNASYIPHKQLTCSAPVPAKAPAASLIPGLALRKPETTEKVYHFQLENLLKLEGLPKLRKLLDALDHAGYDVSDQQAELSFIENIGYRMAKWQNHVEQYLSVSLDNFRIFGNSRYVSKVKFRNGRFSSSESHFDSDVPKMEVPV